MKLLFLLVIFFLMSCSTNQTNIIKKQQIQNISKKAKTELQDFDSLNEQSTKNLIQVDGKNFSYKIPEYIFKELVPFMKELEHHKLDIVQRNKIEQLEFIFIPESQDNSIASKLIFESTLHSSVEDNILCNTELNLIFINMRYFNQLDSQHRTLMLYFALGTCIFERSTLNETFSIFGKDYPKSAMNSQGFDNFTNIPERLMNYYLKELFNTQKYYKKRIKANPDFHWEEL